MTSQPVRAGRFPTESDGVAPPVMTTRETKIWERQHTLMEHSRIVVLKGPPSSGKTTVSSAFGEERTSVGDFGFVTGIDDYLAKLPAEWRSAGGHRGPHTRQTASASKTYGVRCV